MNTFGTNIRFSIFGESHGTSIGGIIDGIPPGILLDMEKISHQMHRRRPGTGTYSTKRFEPDLPIIQSGLQNNTTTGAPLCFIIVNTSQKSSDYQMTIPRPSHADYAAHVKFRGFNMVAGGGHFSGRLTAPLLFFGSICRQILEQRQILINAHIKRIGPIEGGHIDFANPSFPCMDEHFPCLANKDEMLKFIEGLNGDSVGGIIEAVITNVPIGLGQPFFSSIESQLSALLFSIPAVKGVSFGSGFSFAHMQGSLANDPLYYDNEGCVRTKTNNNGGINGGLTNGMPIVFQACIKPTPSIFLEQETIDLTSKSNVTHKISGRHDPCIVPRAVPVVEACGAIVICDALLSHLSDQAFS